MIDTYFSKLGIWSVKICFFETHPICVILTLCTWEKPYNHHLSLFAAARAIDYSFYVFYVNQIGPSGGLEFCGSSAIYGADGRSLAGILDDEEFQYN